jgi:uncharacterized membrane protein (DUF2068 family)
MNRRLRKLRDWLRWEFGRPIEVTTAIRLITLERFLKAVVLIAGGIILLVLSAKTDMHSLVEQVQNQLNLSSGRGWWRQLVSRVLERFGHATRLQADAVAIGAILYGCLEAFEGIGLLLRRRWAEYLVLIATAAFLPLEVAELIGKPTVFKAGALLVNLLIIGYLVWRKRLFLERPSHAEADMTVPVPADLLYPGSSSRTGSR